MTESNDVQALQKISSAVEESQLEIILTNRCIKAQEFLTRKQRREYEQTIQKCNFINNGNLKLESEIRFGEQEIKSLRSALETIKSANVELEKELLLTKEDKIDLIERVNNGIRKYEDLWVTSKKRYDNIPFIKKQQLIINRRKILEDTIVCRDTEKQNLRKVFEERKNELAKVDRQQIIHIAKYMVNERPEVLRCLTQKINEANHLMNEISELQNEKNIYIPKTNYSKVIETKTMNQTPIIIEKNPSDASNNNEDTMLLPKLHLQNIDLDSLTDKLEQVKKADNSLIKTSDSVTIRIDKNPKKINQENIYENNICMSSYFKNISDVKEEGKKDKFQINYTDKKLIHILENIQLPKNNIYNIFSKLNPNEFQKVDAIPASSEINETNQMPEKVDEDGMEIIEEIDMTQRDSANIVPTTQFLDLSQNSQGKKVIFSTVVSVQEVDADKNKPQEYVDEEITNNELNTSVASENSYQTMKENMFKKHNIALSPEFIYTKHPVTPKITDKVKTNLCNENDISENQTQVNDVCRSSQLNATSTHVMENKQEHSVAGFLFTHGPKGILESLDLSMTSSCIEDVDNEFPQCVDSSILLSPKADLKIPENVDNNTVVLSQEVPNFLAGLKKVGFSFFGNSSSENNADSNNKFSNGNNFNFSFSNTEKKNRGGFFNMFN